MTRRTIAVAVLILSIAALAAFAQQPAKKSTADTGKTQTTTASTTQAAPAASPKTAADPKAAAAGCPHKNGADCPRKNAADCPMHAKSATKDGETKAGADCPMMRGQGMQHGQGMQNGKGMQHGQGMQQGKGMQHGNGMQMRGMSGDHEAIHSLMSEHKSVKRTVADIPNGVRTETTSSDPKVVELIRTHVRQMDNRIENGQPIRMFDPLFREIFANSDKIKLEFEDIEGGIRVTETSADPNVVLLIRKHARVLDGFVAEGMAKMHEPTPLPEGYKPASR